MQPDWPLRSVIIYLKLKQIINSKFNIRFSGAKLWNSQIKEDLISI